MGPGAGCAPVLLLSCGLLIGELGVSLADLVRLGLLGLVPALGLGQLEQLGLGVVPLVEQAEDCLLYTSSKTQIAGNDNFFGEEDRSDK